MRFLVATGLLCLGLCDIFAPQIHAQTGGPYDLTWKTVDGGGTTSAGGGSYQLGGTIGQHDAGTANGGAYSLSGGFWPAANLSGVLASVVSQKTHGTAGTFSIELPLTGAVSGSAIGSDPRHYIVDLTSVANAQTLTVTLTNITDTNGGATPSLSVSIGFLLGDSNGDRVVNSGDAQQTRNRSGQTTGAASFRSDYNLDGTINSGDATIVRTRSGQFIP